MRARAVIEDLKITSIKSDKSQKLSLTFFPTFVIKKL